MSWQYYALSEFDPLVIDYQAELEEQNLHVATGEEQQELDTQVDDLEDILTKARGLATETEDPVTFLSPFRSQPARMKRLTELLDSL